MVLSASLLNSTETHFHVRPSNLQTYDFNIEWQIRYLDLTGLLVRLINYLLNLFCAIPGLLFVV